MTEIRTAKNRFGLHSSPYGEIMSRQGADFLKAASVEYSYGTITDKIINRMGTDICPMEKAVKDISDPKEALEAVKETIKKLKEGKTV